MPPHSVQLRVMRALRPEHDAQPPAKWQQRKSNATRLRLLEAAIDCLMECGYAGLTTVSVAERCTLSRGAMHHHFATRRELVAATVDHVLYRRMHLFLEDYFAALRARGGIPDIAMACEVHWQSMHTREYSAYIQLLAAARSDAELAEIFDPVARRFDEVWNAEMIEAFPQWQRHWEAMKLVSDFTYAMHMGMLLHEPVFGQGERMERLRALVVETVEGLYKDV